MRKARGTERGANQGSVNFRHLFPTTCWDLAALPLTLERSTRRASALRRLGLRRWRGARRDLDRGDERGAIADRGRQHNPVRHVHVGAPHRDQPDLDLVGLRHQLDAGIVRLVAGDGDELDAADHRRTGIAAGCLSLHVHRALRRQHQVEALPAVEHGEGLVADLRDRRSDSRNGRQEGAAHRIEHPFELLLGHRNGAGVGRSWRERLARR